MATKSIKSKGRKQHSAAARKPVKGAAISKADAKAINAKAEKKSKAAKKAKAATASAGMSKTTRDQLLGIVKEHDEKMEEFDKAKARVSELKGQVTQTVQEIFRTSKELEQDTDEKGELRKKLVGLEKDRERRGAQLKDAEDTKTGLKETIKGCRVEVFNLIRDMGKGALLFEQEGKKDAAANGATAPKATETTPAPAAPTEPAPIEVTPGWLSLNTVAACGLKPNREGWPTVDALNDKAPTLADVVRIATEDINNQRKPLDKIVRPPVWKKIHEKLGQFNDKFEQPSVTELFGLMVRAMSPGYAA